MKKHSFMLYGHRGARGLMPENTLPAYAKALEIGVDFVDMDVVMTRDKVVVVYHDLALNPNITRDKAGIWIKGKHLINQMTFAELQKYDVGRIDPRSPYAAYFPDQVSVDGTRIPSLEQVIDYVKQSGGDQIGFQVEIKDDPEHPEEGYAPDEMAHAIARILQRKDVINRTEVQAFNWQCLLELQKIDPRIKTAYLTDSEAEARMTHPDPDIAGRWTGGHLLNQYDQSTAQMIQSLGGWFWEPQDIDVTEEKLAAAHAHGLKMVTWSSPEPSGKEVDLALTEKLIAMGIDGIITDRPDKVMRFKGE